MFTLHLPKSIYWANVSFEVPVSFDKYPSNRSNTHLPLCEWYFPNGWVSKWILLGWSFSWQEVGPFFLVRPHPNWKTTPLGWCGKKPGPLCGTICTSFTLGKMVINTGCSWIVNTHHQFQKQSRVCILGANFNAPSCFFYHDPCSTSFAPPPVPRRSKSSGSSPSMGGFQLSMVQPSLMRWVPGIIRLFWQRVGRITQKNRAGRLLRCWGLEGFGWWYRYLFSPNKRIMYLSRRLAPFFETWVLIFQSSMFPLPWFFVEEE